MIEDVKRPAVDEIEIASSLRQLQDLGVSPSFNSGASSLEVKVDRNVGTLDLTGLPVASLRVNVAGLPLDLASGEEQAAEGGVDFSVTTASGLTSITVIMQKNTVAHIHLEARSAYPSIEVHGRGAWCILTLHSARSVRTSCARLELRPLDPYQLGRSASDIFVGKGRLIARQRLKVDRIHLVDGSHVYLERPIGLGHVECSDGARLRFYSPAQVTLVSFVGTGDGSSIPMLKLRQGSWMSTANLSECKVVVEKGAKFSIGRNVSGVQLVGSGEVEVLSAASQVHFGGHLSLSMTPNSMLVGASGVCLLSQCADARIQGSRTVEGAALRVVGLSNNANLSRISVSNVGFSPTIDGIRAITALTTEAAHAAPGVDSTDWRRDTLRRLAQDPAGSAIEPVYASALAHLATVKGAPSSVRAKLVWQDYRFRNVTAPGMAERWILKGYRLLGYGELPHVAMLTWLVAACLLTVADCADLAWQPTWDGVWCVTQRYSLWLASPIHILSFGDSFSIDTGWPDPLQTLARLLVAIPFATGVLALRKFVKRTGVDEP